MKLQLFDSYPTDDSTSEIYLKITIGYGQIGSTTVSLDNTRYQTEKADKNGNYPDSFSLLIGQNNQLKGKLLIVSSTVTRIQPVSASSLLIELDDGNATHKYSLLSGILSQPGDTIDYYAEITLT